MSWLLTVLGIVALVMLHELGHFTVAKLVGMRVERFSLFFPPKLFGVRRGETEYMIGAIPLGGYVKITGMNPEEVGELDPEVARRAYYRQSPWKRVVVILAGPGMNLLIAFVLFTTVLAAGDRNGELALYNLHPAARPVIATAKTVEPGQPAYGLLHPGDRILAADGRPVGPEEAREAIGRHRCRGPLVNGCVASTPVHLTVLRTGHRLTLSITPRYSAAAKRVLIGFTLDGAAKQFGVLDAASTASAEMWHVTTRTLTGFVDALTSAKSRHEVTSIVGLTRATHESVALGTGYALVVLGFISLALAVVNLFPFLPLDGGHILWSVAEKVRGRRISLAAMYRYSSVGIILLLFLVINGVGNDIRALGG